MHQEPNAVIPTVQCRKKDGGELHEGTKNTVLFAFHLFGIWEHHTSTTQLDIFTYCCTLVMLHTEIVACECSCH